MLKVICNRHNCTPSCSRFSLTCIMTMKINSGHSEPITWRFFCAISMKMRHFLHQTLGVEKIFLMGKIDNDVFLGVMGRWCSRVGKYTTNGVKRKMFILGIKKKTIFFSLNLTSKYISTVSDLNTTSIWKVTSEIFKDFPQLSRDYHLKICHVFSMVKITFKSYLR